MSILFTQLSYFLFFIQDNKRPITANSIEISKNSNTQQNTVETVPQFQVKQDFSSICVAPDFEGEDVKPLEVTSDDASKSVDCEENDEEKDEDLSEQEDDAENNRNENEDSDEESNDNDSNVQEEYATNAGDEQNVEACQDTQDVLNENNNNSNFKEEKLKDETSNKVTIVDPPSSKQKDISSSLFDVSEWEDLQRAIEDGEEIKDESSDDNNVEDDIQSVEDEDDDDECEEEADEKDDEKEKMNKQLDEKDSFNNDKGRSFSFLFCFVVRFVAPYHENFLSLISS